MPSPADKVDGLADAVHIGQDRSLEPTVVAGPPDTVARRLVELIGLGFAGVNFLPARPDHPSQVERLAREVLPEVRNMSAAPIS